MRPAGAPHPGLCAACVHARIVVSGRGSAFWLCRRAAFDARLRKYPPLPVLECVGWERGEPQGADTDGP